jgi:penicillin-binding protein 2A
LSESSKLIEIIGATLSYRVVLLLKTDRRIEESVDMGTNKKASPPGKKGKKKSFSYRNLIVGTIIAAILAVICAMGGYIVIILNGSTILKENEDKINITSESTLIFDNEKNEVAKLYRENRESVEIEEIPVRLQQAFIATEDKRFESHAGVDFWAIGRALVKDITAGAAVEGGSTITQQLAKNVFLSSQKTFLRKATEVSIAIAIDNDKTKEEILELYLNRIYFGSGAYGIKAAAKVYFNKSDLTKLEVWEMATLAALPKAPSRYSPLTNPDMSKERRAVVLRLMTDQGYITEEERAKAAAVPYIPPTTSGAKEFQTFMDYVVKESEEKYGIEEEELLTRGYRIYTTMDAKAQRTMEQTYANASFFQKDAADGEKIQSSMVIVNHKDGGLIGMIGGRDYQAKGLNRAFSLRQPGSAFKPIIAFAPAIESGKWNPYSTLDDTQKSFGTGSNPYKPRNYDNVYLGPITMMEAVKKSKNVATVDLLSQIGVGEATKFAKKLGIDLDEKDRNLAIALGGLTHGASPFAMATAYGAFANNGIQYETHAIIKIEDANGKEIVAFKPEKKKVMEPKTAYYMTLMMQTVLEAGGTGVKAKFDWPIAGKTGSTGLDIKGIEKYDRDVWFVGYTPEWTAAVWQGFDKTDSKHYVTVGSGSTAAIFKEVMSKALAGKKKSAFVKPDGVPALNEPPKTSSDLAAVYESDKRSVKLSWTSLGDKIAYQLFRKGTKDAEFKQLTQVPTTEVNDITITPGETYQYYLVPLNTETSIAGEKSNVVEVAIPAEGDMLDPLQPSPSPGSGSPSPSPSGSPGTKPTPSPGTGNGNNNGNGGNNGNGNGNGGNTSTSPTSTPKPSSSSTPSVKPTPTPSPSSSPQAGSGETTTVDGVVKKILTPGSTP